MCEEHAVLLARIAHDRPDEHHLSLVQFLPEREVVIAQRVCLREIELADPVLGREPEEEVDADDGRARFAKRGSRLREKRRPEHHRHVAVLHERLIVDNDQGDVVRVEANPALAVPQVRIQVLHRREHAGSVGTLGRNDRGDDNEQRELEPLEAGEK